MDENISNRVVSRNQEAIQKLDSALNRLRKTLKMETAIVSNINDNSYVISALDSDMPVFNLGDSFELSDTYCAVVHESKETVVYNNVGNIEEMLLHPVYIALQLLSYIGTPILVNGEIWGTLNFSSTLVREHEFSQEEILLVENLASEYGSVLALTS